jgi:hypothetical protein
VIHGHDEETAIEMSQTWLCQAMAGGVLGDPPLAIPGGLDAVMEIARGQRVDVLLADLLLRAPGRNQLEPVSRKLLEDCVRQAAARDMSASRDVSFLFEAASHGGLDLLVLKGAALAYTHYPRPYLRPRNDLDLYIRLTDLDRAEAVLASRGYERTQEANAELWTGQRHYTKTTPAGTSHVDLHWRVVNPLAFADVLRFDDVWSRSVSVPALGPLVRTLSPPDALLLACLHRVAHHQDRINLLWLWDIHLIASRLSAAEWDHVVWTAKSLRMQTFCARGLSLVGECFGTVVPEALRQANGTPADEPGAAFLRDGLRPVDVACADLAALTSWRSKLALIREHVCPPVAYMRTKYARCPPVLLPLAYLHRIVRGAPRWFER